MVWKKITPIWDSYRAAGELPAPNETYVEDLVNAAIDIHAFMRKHTQEFEMNGKPAFENRMRIHTGPVVDDIIGVKKFAYYIWGNTANKASRMESIGEAGKINISKTTYAVVKDRFSFKHRHKIAEKGKGEIDMYFVDHSFSEG